MSDVHLRSLLLIEIAEATWSEALRQSLERFKPAGLFFRKLTSPESTWETCHESARALGSLPLMAIEEEGGGVLADLFPALPRALAFDASGAKEAGAFIGRAMKLLGLNFNLAPTIDIEPSAATGQASEARGDTEGERILPGEMAGKAEAFVEALRSNHVLSCGRHFPGLPSGGTTAKGMNAIVVDRSLAALWREELVPYRALGEKLAAIEISHAVHRAYDYEFLRPASLSPGVIEGLLRAKLGYQGIALADAALAAGAAGIDLDEAVVRALAAGCDLVVVPGERKLLEGICAALGRAVDSGRLPGARISQSQARVKSAQQRVRRPPRKLAAAEYALLAGEFETFARRFGREGNAGTHHKRPAR